MASIKLLLRNTKSLTPVSVNYDVHISGNTRLRGSTNTKVLPKYWDQKKQKIRNVTDLYSTKDKLNRDLLNFKKFVLDQLAIYTTNNLNEQKELLKQDIGIYFGRIEAPTNEEMTFYKFVDIFIDQADNRINNSTGKKLSKRTILDYKLAKKLIEDFENLYKYRITFESITLEFYYSFIEYLEDKHSFSVNTIGKYIKILKAFLRAATDEGYNNNLSFQNKKFIKPTAPSEQIYLNENELLKIIKLDLTELPKTSNARDLFIIGAYTGLRVSDFNNLTKENIKIIQGKRMFGLIVQKTGNYLPIPIHPQVEKILKKHKGNPPQTMKPQDINDELRIIGRKAKIKEITTINTIKGGENITKMVPKYKLIKNHTARRSFCTNAYIAGMSTLDIMAISGHTSEKTFLNYIKITADERAIKIAENPFFNPKLNLT
ncbi:tyrosine-type recombinase/integrase [Lutibacter citreus]|uniref:tyrosine-type recombinase/integrase n=1 Tax=Lutibacter citreus TaxID=2138210 RepID=UPI000DBE201E|nr:site-specific integrase [Lutibacter citreus]